MIDGYPRDLHGYGEHPPDPRWPGGARIAVSFVLNWEEGGERNTLHGDDASEHAIQDVIGAEPWPGARHISVESMFDYGSRAGVWRLLRLFEGAGIPLTVFAVGMAVERSPHIVRRMADAGHEICSHGYRWLDYRDIPEDVERDHVHLALRAIEEAIGSRPVGWYTGRCSANTRRLVVEAGGFEQTATATVTTSPTGRSSTTSLTWSSPTPSTSTTCASSRPPTSPPVPTSSMS